MPFSLAAGKSQCVTDLPAWPIPSSPSKSSLFLFSTCCVGEEPRGRYRLVVTSPFLGVGPRPTLLLGAPWRPGERKQVEPACKQELTVSSGRPTGLLCSGGSNLGASETVGFVSVQAFTESNLCPRLGGTSGFLIPILICFADQIPGTGRQ